MRILTMKTIHLALLAIVFTVGCAKIEIETNTAVADNDGDGYATADGDCDDDDPVKNPSDADGDGFSSCEGDCDDNNSRTYPGAAKEDSADACMTDADGDGFGEPSPPEGIIGGSDCDDGDTLIGSSTTDGDCDGISTDDDCDDEDDGSNSVADDGDCDGVLSADDCADDDANMPNNDADCDGLSTADDCDDTDPDSTLSSTDGACGSPDNYVASHGGSMVRIDAQTFEMGCLGSADGCPEDALPAHSVGLSNDYYIGETEVTQGEYEAMMGSNPSSFGACGVDCPVEQVSWHMAGSFANAVSDSEGFEQCYDCTGDGSDTRCTVAVEPPACGGYRLPTEAEWEAAALCGDDTVYAGSNMLGGVAWFEANAEHITHAVATKTPNSCSLFDMTGNVSEWVFDWYGSSFYASAEASSDPIGESSGEQRGVRGGAWNDTGPNSRLTARAALYPNAEKSETGFRLARSSP